MIDLEKKRHWLATEVMKWEVKPIQTCEGYYEGSKFKYWYRTTFTYPDEVWKPDTDIAQAMMLVDKYPIAELHKREDIWYVSAINVDISSATNTSLPEAICEAVLQATGYYKENKDD